MKKVLSLVLAVLMVLSLSVVAFANNVEEEWTATVDGALTKPEDKFELGIGDEGIDPDNTVPDEPGATYYITIMKDGEMITDADELNHVKVSVTEKGDKMLKDYAVVKHNGVYKIKLTTEAYYTAAKKAATWTITMKEDGRKVAVGTFTPCQKWANENLGEVDHYKQLVVVVDNAATKDGTDYTDGYTDFDNAEAIVTVGNYKLQAKHDYAEVRLDTATPIWMGAKVTHKVEGVVLYNVAAAPKEVWVAHEDATDITYVTFKGDFAFDYMGTMHVEAPKDAFVYALVDGKYVAGEFEWNEENDCWETKTDKFIDVVISDVELKNVVAAEGGKENPGTGSVDFVNVAVALGVVSLAAAGAVALKK
ncbi:MAG: hypothetical protein IJM93_03140 [Oscillospiraceae bacterium]|nr:hypothetical protein [Oscillospiraceae bacterium]